MFRTVCLAFVTMVASLALFMTPAYAARSFPETGYSITNSAFQDYFDHRGGAGVLGFPVSREFDFMGTRVQFFQRAVLQQTANGGVALLNIMDGGLMPYTHINGSTFPAPDPAVVQASPNPASADYADQAIAFVKANAPDNWQGMDTNFYKTFASTVSMEDAFPNGDGNDGLLDLINLEIWGLPTSKPTMDPANSNFVYLRFQRGIMHFDRTTGLTQGILLADYMKSLITGQNLPGDLAAEANTSALYLQYNNSYVGGLNRPSALPGTNMFAAFEKDGVTVAPATTQAPAPATTPAAPALAPAAATPVVGRPDLVTIVGNDYFTAQTKKALELLPASIRDYVWKIVEAPAPSYVDLKNRTLYVSEADAFPYDWQSKSEIQQQWYAGEIMHASVHLEQYYTGQPYQGTAAEQAALLRMKAFTSTIDTSDGRKLTVGATAAVNAGNGGYGHFELRNP
ncbi:MAG TPA: hypothetical protein VHS28_07495 [Chloroflexota bacterium]|nr:hypothetical protein [Chloroflexota bacterium]